jgi:hypothetical protein
MSGYDWNKVKQYPPLREQMKELIAWANHKGGLTMVEFDENGDPIITPEQYAVAAQNGVGKWALISRLNNGWELEKALTTPPVPRRKYSEHWLQVAEQNGISKPMYWQRVKQMGWSEEKAATTSKEEAWADHLERRAVKIISHEELERAQRYGLSKHHVLYRLRRGWTREDALTVPLIPASQRKRKGKQLQEKKCGSCKGCANVQREVTV